MADSLTRFCVIGAGAAGLCAARHVAGNSKFRVIVYEQTDGVAGTWVYTEETGRDRHGEPIHSSMYRNLRTNLAAKIMNFPDFVTMNAVQPSCVGHEEVRSYLRNYAEHFDLLKHVQFSTKVVSVRPYASDGKEKWSVRVRHLGTGAEKETIFDGVFVCNGHYFDPYVPPIPGVETFPGTILHSHSYRKPEDFAGRRVFILGAASSGIDIGIDLADHASQVYLSHNNERLPSALPANVTQVTGVERLEGRSFVLKDCTAVIADVFLFCTGYRFSFPFLDKGCGIGVDENHVTPLYKHLINVEHPTMCVVGVPSIVVPFPLFHVQVQYFLAVFSGTASLPAKEVMLEDTKLKGQKKRHAHKLAEEQWEYNDSLAAAGGFERLPKFYKIGYEAWGRSRKSNLLRYKDAKFLVSEDGESVEVTLPSGSLV